MAGGRLPSCPARAGGRYPWYEGIHPCQGIREARRCRQGGGQGASSRRQGEEGRSACQAGHGDPQARNVAPEAEGRRETRRQADRPSGGQHTGRAQRGNRRPSQLRRRRQRQGATQTRQREASGRQDDDGPPQARDESQASSVSPQAAGRGRQGEPAAEQARAAAGADCRQGLDGQIASRCEAGAIAGPVANPPAKPPAQPAPKPSTAATLRPPSAKPKPPPRSEAGSSAEAPVRVAAPPAAQPSATPPRSRAAGARLGRNAGRRANPAAAAANDDAGSGPDASEYPLCRAAGCAAHSTPHAICEARGIQVRRSCRLPDPWGRHRARHRDDVCRWLRAAGHRRDLRREPHDLARSRRQGRVLRAAQARLRRSR